jgi:hypothetical protein
MHAKPKVTFVMGRPLWCATQTYCLRYMSENKPVSLYTLMYQINVSSVSSLLPSLSVPSVQVPVTTKYYVILKQTLGEYMTDDFIFLN